MLSEEKLAILEKTGSTDVQELVAEVRHARLMLGALKAWAGRSGDTYAEKLAISGLEGVAP